MEFPMVAVGWLVLLVVLLGLEAVTLGLTTIWFAGGALAGFIFAMAGADWVRQIAAFCVVSGVLMAVMRPVAVRWLNKGRIKTNVQSLIGETAVVTEEIDNLENRGQVQVHGQFWTARSEENIRLSEATRVRIQKISGVKLIVKEDKEDE